MQITLYIRNENWKQFVKEPNKSELINGLLRLHYSKSTPVSKDTKQIEYGNHDVNLIVDTFKKAFGTTKTTKYDRYAASRLAKEYGAKYTANSIKSYAERSKDKFAPSVNSVSEFETKLPAIRSFMERKRSERTIVE